MEYIGQCLQVLSASIMYKSRAKIFLTDEHVYFYLFLCVPFNPANVPPRLKQIERLLNAVICRFQDNYKFYSIFFKNLIKLFECDEMPGLEARAESPGKSECTAE